MAQAPYQASPAVSRVGAFAGGPWNNFALHATAAMIERLRAQRQAKGSVIVDEPSSQQCVATSSDAELAGRARQEELIGTTVDIDGVRFGF